MASDDAQTAGGNEWEFQPEDVIEKPAEFRVSIGDQEIDTARCTVLRRLVGEDDGEQYYHVEDGFNETQLYAAETIEGTYRSVDTGTERSGERDSQ